jgi:thiamine kinase-like enzyme
MFSNLSFVRAFFTVSEEKIPLPLNLLKQALEIYDGVPFINIGTKGVDQTTTIITLDQKPNKFLKLANNFNSKKLVKNEAETLKQLEKIKEINSPQLYYFNSNNNYSYFVTEVVVGNKLKFTNFTKKIFNLLLTIGLKPKDDLGMIQIFSHGDFCPWNMLLTKDNEIVLIDWEMAGYKPLGYDLFTFIFQTNFILNPKKGIDKILSDNIEWIEQYFDHYNVIEYKKYLYSFASQRAAKESINETKKLYNKYIKLVAYYE